MKKQHQQTTLTGQPVRSSTSKQGEIDWGQDASKRTATCTIGTDLLFEKPVPNPIPKPIPKPTRKRKPKIVNKIAMECKSNEYPAPYHGACEGCDHWDDINSCWADESSPLLCDSDTREEEEDDEDSQWTTEEDEMERLRDLSDAVWERLRDGGEFEPEDEEEVRP